MEEHPQEQERPSKRGDRWLFVLIFCLFLVGFAIRGYGYFGKEAGSSAFHDARSPHGAQKTFLQRRSVTTLNDPSTGEFNWAGIIAPYLTEGGLSFFLGFCLGYLLRLVAKMTMLIIGAVYFGLILLSHYGMVTVDWGGIQELVRHLLMNTQTQLQGLQGLLTVSLPSISMGALGLWRGVKKK